MINTIRHLEKEIKKIREELFGKDKEKD